MDGTIIYDAYSTPVCSSRVMLAYTTRIAWCCLFSYFISELRRDGLWAYPQLSSYSWWGCEYNMYRCWQNYNSMFWEKLMYVSYTTDRPGSSVDHPIGALALICLWVLLTWLTLRLWDALSRWRHSWRVFAIQCACQFSWTGHFNSCMFMINYWSVYHQAAW